MDERHGGTLETLCRWEQIEVKIEERREDERRILSRDKVQNKSHEHIATLAERSRFLICSDIALVCEHVYFFFRHSCGASVPAYLR